MLEDMGIQLRVELLTDASAARGIAARRGLGQVRHIEVSQLWLQDKVNKGEIMVEKVDGTKNLADALTKHVDGEMYRVHVEGMGIEFKEGRHELAPKTTEEGGEEEWENDEQ